MTIDWNWIQGDGGDIPTYSAKMDRRVIAAIFDEGVIRGLKCTASGVDRVITVGNGQGVVAGDDTSDQQPYVVTVYGTGNTITMTAAPGSGSRIDLVGLKIQDHVEGGAVGNDIVIAKVDGVSATTPVAPAVPDSFLVLAQTKITAGQTALTTAADVTERRVFTGPKDPVGTVKLWIGVASRIPVGWAILGGQVLGAFSAYPDLADLLGVSAGNITLPVNTQGRALAGVDTGQPAYAAPGTQTGVAAAALGIDNLPEHRHANDHDHANVLTGFVTADHGHAFTTGGQSADHTHFAVGNYVVTGGVGTFAGGGLGAQQPFPGGASVDHSHSGSTGGISANHQHNVDLPAFVGLTGYAGSATPAAVPVVQPTVALYVLVRVS